MPPHKLKDPFHKLKEKLSKYLEKSPSPKAAPPMATSSLFGLGLGNRSERPRSSETNSQGSSRRSSGQKMFPKELAPDLALFNNIFARLHMKCCVCDAPLSLEIDTHVAAWLAGAQVIPPTSQVSVLQCTKCDRLTCIGCGKMPKMNKRNVFTTLGVVNHCCYEGRLFGVWLLLARFDQAESPAEKETSAAILRRGTVKKSKSKKKSLSTQNGVGYSIGSAGYYDAEDLDLEMEGGFDDIDDITGFSSGMPIPGYYGQYMAPTYIVRDQKAKVREEKTKSQDKLLIDTMKLLVAFFPGSGLPDGPLEEIRLYRLSFLFDRIAELFRNDAIIDITLRKELYTQVFTFVETVANDPDLVGLLLEERPDKSHSPGIHSIRQSSQRPGFLLEDIQDTPGTFSPSVFTGSFHTYRQAKTLMAISSMPQGDPPALAKNMVRAISQEQREDDDSIRMCERIVEIYERLQKHETCPPLAGDDQTDVWTKYAEENRVMFDDDVLKNHRYLNEINNLKSSKGGRLTTICKEIATMTTSLPAGIFVKVAESRSDAMKVLIVGPEGSPYAHGLFVFDLFLDAQYPISPPKMAFVLDGNDSEAHSFNPNLHRGGGVCLSLLNTWEGNPNEMWQPNKSTVLSVLISVQAMILGAPIPWVNEPGFATHENTPQAKDHKLLIQTKTVKYAMIGWLENQFNARESKEYIWKDISHTYWKHNGKAALETVKGWAVDNPDLVHFGARAPAKKRKGKSKEVQPEPVPTSGGQDLVEKLSQCLGLPGDNSYLPSHKRKASSSGGTLNDPKKQKSESLEEDSIEMRWFYTGQKTQKQVRAACKEFGIGAAPTIDASIDKLQTHVNTKGKASEELVDKWGEMREVFRLVDGYPVDGGQPFV